MRTRREEKLDSMLEIDRRLRKKRKGKRKGRESKVSFSSLPRPFRRARRILFSTLIDAQMPRDAAHLYPSDVGKGSATEMGVGSRVGSEKRTSFSPLALSPSDRAGPVPPLPTSPDPVGVSGRG